MKGREDQRKMGRHGSSTTCCPELGPGTEENVGGETGDLGAKSGADVNAGFLVLTNVNVRC